MLFFELRRSRALCAIGKCPVDGLGSLLRVHAKKFESLPIPTPERLPSKN